MSPRRKDRRLVVLESFAKPRPDSNAYPELLFHSLPKEIDPVYFSWRAALFGRIDVFHCHWPELLIRSRHGPFRWIKRALFLLFMLRLALGRIPVVRTLHNIRSHEPESALERILLGILDAKVAGYIRLNSITPLPRPVPVETILHGHYQDVLKAFPKSAPAPGRLLAFGLIRKYKGLVRLAQAFSDIPDPSLRLRILGQPIDEETVAALRERARKDPRIEVVAAHVEEAELVREVSEAVLVVLPYPEFHNSGVALYALSLARPILVPENLVTLALREEVGEAWVHLFRGDLGPADLAATVSRIGRCPPQGMPALGERNWERLGQSHARFFEQVSRRKA